MNGKVAIVTGSTNGIGKVTARRLAEMGAEVVLISRNQQKLEDTVEFIKAETDNPNVSYIQADLSSLADIRAAANTFLSQHQRLDVLVNNAGAFFNSRETSADGYEMTFALNHLNYFLLTNLLLDTLKQTATNYGEARVVNVASAAHYNGKIKFDDLQGASSWGAYSDSKLMNVVFTFALANRLEGTGVTANTLHPGFVNTGFGMNNIWFVSGLLKFIQNLVAISPEKGAETMTYLAASPEVKDISGKYWDNKKPAKPHDAATNVDVQNRLWDISAELTGLQQPALV